jgi:quercetin dioxygenase-like cupin family protein
MDPAVESYLVRQDEGRRISPGMLYKLESRRVGGTVSVFEGVLPPGMRVGPHTHTREDERSFVIEGELTFTVGDERIEARAGSTVVKPRNVPHTFVNLGHAAARILEITSPGNLDDYYPELMPLLARSSVSWAAVTELAARYGIHYHLDDGRQP